MKVYSIACTETHNYTEISVYTRKIFWDELGNLGYVANMRVTVIKIHENKEFSQIKTVLTAHLEMFSLTSLIISLNMCQNGSKAIKTLF